MPLLLMDTRMLAVNQTLVDRSGDVGAAIIVLLLVLLVSHALLAAAGSEYRRAHQFRSDELAGPWSHGDASMTNVTYDTKTNRARLIDFEIIHEKSLPVAARKADDLLVFLLDLVSNVSRREWLPLRSPRPAARDRADRDRARQRCPGAGIVHRLSVDAASGRTRLVFSSACSFRHW